VRSIQWQRHRSPKSWIRAARIEAHAIYLTLVDRRVPWHVRGLAICVAAYALSPIDLLPDFIPVVGYGDDWIVVTLRSLAVAQLFHRKLSRSLEQPSSIPWLRNRDARRVKPVMTLRVKHLAFGGGLLRHATVRDLVAIKKDRRLYDG
jgi:uncharacterized membrane protein YkvA (DUF1232 family)